MFSTKQRSLCLSVLLGCILILLWYQRSSIQRTTTLGKVAIRNKLWHEDDVPEQNQEPVREPFNEPPKEPVKEPFTEPSNGLNIDPRDILVIMKSGATEIWEKLPTQMATVLTQIPNIIYFSDMAENVGGVEIIDALDQCNESLKDEHPDFQLYRAQNHLKNLGQRINAGDPSLKGGWNLDKYKFPRQLQKTWEIWPSAKWYVFIEADTYLSWNNLLRYLDELNPSDLIYAGKDTFIDGVHFAHGGTGYVLSQAAMKHTVGEDPDFADKYEAEMDAQIFGDLVLGKAMADYGIPLLNTGARMRTEVPRMIQFDNHNMAEPVLSMHHMTPAEVDATWQFEQKKAAEGQPLLFKDIFKSFIYPHLTDSRENWWSLARHPKFEEAVAQIPHFGRDTVSCQSFEICKELCDRMQQCLTYSWYEGKCELSNGAMLGESVMPEDGSDGPKSGWQMKRIKKMIDEVTPEKHNSSRKN